MDRHTRVLRGRALGLPQLLRFLPRSTAMANQLATYSTACRKSNRLVFSLLSIAWTWLYSQTYPGFLLYRCLEAPHAPTSMYNVRSVVAPQELQSKAMSSRLYANWQPLPLDICEVGGGPEEGLGCDRWLLS